MKAEFRVRLAVPTVLFVSAAVLLTGADTGSAQPSGLTVHEWGTFTSVAGEDGSAVDWDARGCQDDLPRFVNVFGYPGFKGRLAGTVRMETPVIYFYSSRELEASVKVAFPHGLITEWYPQAEQVAGTIEWKKITVQPDTTPVLPVEAGHSHYYAARETDAAPIAAGNQHERFLFYRGVGRSSVPLSARLSDDGTIMVENLRHGTIPRVVLFENREGHIGYREVSPLENRVTLAPPSLDGSIEELRTDLETALVAQGLFPREAHAMVETWRDSWFEEGSRLIYILPSPAVDSMLPLQVEPAPEQTSRVFVGRIELITPAMKRSVEHAVAGSDRSVLSRYGRFLDPILTRISAGNPSAASQVEQFRRNAPESVVSRSCR